MPLIPGNPFTRFRNVEVKSGILKFGSQLSSAPSTTTGDWYLYVNTSNQIIFVADGTSTILGTAGQAIGVPSLDAIFQGDQTLNLGGLSTLTIDRTSGNNDVLTLTNTGAGSGHVLQITNVGTGKDINGTSDSWSITKAGVAILEELTIDGTEGSNIFTVTKGDVRFLDGALAITDDDNAASFTVTNDTATTASVFVLAGSGAFTGSTITSFLTITPSGLTSGTAVYLPVAALTTGKAIHVVGNAVTSGILVHIASSVAGTTLTGAGRLFKVDHTGNATDTGIIAQINSAAADETTILALTASAALAAGKVLSIDASSMTTGAGISFSIAALTTGIGISMTDIAALTTGTGISLAHATSAIADGGSLIRLASTGINTGGATNGTMLDIQTTSQVAGTQVLVKAGAVTTGVLLSLITTTGLTSGSVIRATTSTAGAIATNGAFSFNASGAFTSTADTLGAFHVAGAATLTGTIMSILGGAHTTGIGLHISDPSTGMTSGSLLRIATATTGAVATNGLVSIRATGAYTSTSNAGLLDVVASAITGIATVARLASTAASQTATQILNITQSGATLTAYTGSIVSLTAGFSGSSSTGSALLITSVHTTAGDGLKIVANALTLGAATGILVSHTTSVLGAGTSLVRIASTGIDTGTTTGVLLDLSTTSAVGSTQVLLTDSSADTAARIGIFSKVTNALAVLAVPLKTSNVAVVNSKFTKHFVMTDGTKTTTIWLSQDATDPNGVLTGVAGDLCLNGPSNKPYYCTTTGTVWATVV